MTKKSINKSKKEDSDYEDEYEDLDAEIDAEIDADLDADLDADADVDADADHIDLDIVDENELNDDDEDDDNDNYNIEDYIENENDFLDKNTLDPNNFIKKTNIEIYNYTSKENRISMNKLTRYEMVRILGERTKQLTMGAKPMVKNCETLSYDKIAEEEFRTNMIPYKIRRPLPNGLYELWNMEELSKDHLYFLLE